MSIVVQMQIFVRFPNARTETLDVKSSDTIFNVNETIFDLKKYPVHEQRLIFGQSELNDCHTLADYNIQKDSTLFLKFRLIRD